MAIQECKISIQVANTRLDCGGEGAWGASSRSKPSIRDGTRGEEALLNQCRHYLDRFNLPAENLVSKSYADLLLAAYSET